MRDIYIGIGIGIVCMIILHSVYAYFRSVNLKESVHVTMPIKQPIVYKTGKEKCYTCEDQEFKSLGIVTSSSSASSCDMWSCPHATSGIPLMSIGA